MFRNLALCMVLAACSVLAKSEEGAGKVEVLEPVFSIEQNQARLRFKLSVEKGTLLGIEILRAGISRWTDDKSTNLGTKDAKEFYGEASFMTMGAGADLITQVQGKHKPAEGAKSMSIEGEIPIKVASDLQEGESKEVSLKEGASFKVGPHTFKIAKIEPAKDMLDFKIQEVVRVQFTFDVAQQLESTDFLKVLKFVNAEGKEVPSSMKNFQGSFKSGGEHKLSYVFLPTDKPLTVAWAVYGKITVQKVPLKFTGPIVESK